MNTSMFLPQVAEADLHDMNDNQADDVNSVVEYIAVALGYDQTPDDEDDDNGQNFHPEKTADYFYQQISNIIKSGNIARVSQDHFVEYEINYCRAVYKDILTPPPKS